MIEQLLAFQEDIYATNVAKGFWVPDRSKGEAVALICSELYEAVESHRKNKHYIRYATLINNQVDLTTLLTDETNNNDFAEGFRLHVKDTVEDEIADAVIRILDCCRGWNWKISNVVYMKESTGNFAHDILRINWYVINAYHRKVGQNMGLNADIFDWGPVLSSIEALCCWYQINLVQHVEWKLRYNKTRPFLHGKKY